MKHLRILGIACILLAGCSTPAAAPSPSASAEPTSLSTPTHSPTPTEAPPTTQLYISQTFRLAFELPLEMELRLYPVSSRVDEPYRDSKEFIQVTGVSDTNLTLDAACEKEAAGDWDAVYGNDPVIESTKVAGVDACMIRPTEAGQNQAALVVRYPGLWTHQMLEMSFPFAIVRAHPDRIDSIAETLRFEIEPQEYLASVLSMIEQNSMYGADVDWDALRTKYLKAEMTWPEAYEAVALVLQEIGDHHGFLWDRSFVEQVMEPAADDMPAEMPSGTLLDEQIGYIKLPPALGDSQFANDYASAAQAEIRKIDQDQPCGWIIDLQGNRGGNMYPMIVGIGPVLGSGRAFGFASKATFAWFSYRNGQLVANGREMPQPIEMSDAPYELANTMPPVAILTDEMTASSGEIVAVAFHNRPDARSFGSATGGYTTAIDTLEMFDGSWLGISTSWYVDRKLVSFMGVPIPPDVVTDHPQEEALEWLSQQPACNANP